MLTIHRHQLSIMVLFAIALHIVWVVVILIDVSSIHATALAALARYIEPPLLLAFVITVAVILALIGLFTRSSWIVMFLLPQQALLMMGAAGAIEAIWLSQFADGVIRPRAFIAADQMYAVLAAIGHTTAITALALRRLEDGK